MYLAQIPTLTIVLLVIAAIMLVITIILGIIGKKAQKRQAEQDEQIKASAQQVTMLIIDKKLMKMKDSGLPDNVISQTPWYANRQG